MAPGLLFFYAIALLLIGGGGVLAFALTRRWGRLPAAVLGVATSLLLVLAWPLPIHGGVTFLGEVLLGEWRSQHRAAERQVVSRQREAVVERQVERFAGDLPYVAGEPLKPPWRAVTVAGAPAWLDTASRLVWSGWLDLGGADRPRLDDAKAACRGLPPAGYWGLPSEAENLTAWRDGGARVLPPAPASTLSYIVDADLGVELATYQLRGRGSGQQDRLGRFVVRCVARAAGAPAGGYRQADIPRDEWNRYQMGKLGEG